MGQGAGGWGGSIEAAAIENRLGRWRDLSSHDPTPAGSSDADRRKEFRLINSGLVTSVPMGFLCTTTPNEPLEAHRIILDCAAASG